MSNPRSNARSPATTLDDEETSGPAGDLLAVGDGTERRHLVPGTTPRAEGGPLRGSGWDPERLLEDSTTTFQPLV